MGMTLLAALVPLRADQPLNSHLSFPGPYITDLNSRNLSLLPKILAHTILPAVEQSRTLVQGIQQNHVNKMETEPWVG